MTQLVECPACEVASPWSGPLDTEFNCPYCHHRFVIANALIREQSPDTSAAKVDQSLPIPRKIAKRRAQVDTPISEPLVLPSESEGTVWPEVAVSPEPIRVAQSTKRTKRSPALWWIGGFAAIVLVAGAAIAIQSLAHSRDSTATGRDRTKMPSVPVSLAPVPTDANSASAPSPAVAPNPERDWENLRLATREEYYALWNTIHPHLVRLQVQSPAETRTVAGVIVDSRGFVATSYQAIRDAVSIEVRSASKALIAGEPFGELTDQVRGLIAKDESRDLAILEINRRFVSSFATIKFSAAETALPGDRCVVATPPQGASRLWIADFPIRHVQTFDRLMPQFQTAMSRIPQIAGTSSQWIVGGIPEERFVPGSPVFRLTGELVAVVTCAAAESNAIACPSLSIAELIRAAPAAASPFPIDPIVKEAVSSSVAIKEILPDRESPSFAAAEELQQLTQSVSQFDFLPKTPEQQKTLGDFAAALFRFDEWLQRPDLTDEQRLEAEQFLDQFLDGIQSEIRTSINEHPDHIAPLNQWAWESAERGGNFVAVGDVVRSGLQESDVAPYVIFRLPGAGSHVFTTIRHEGPIFLPGSRWFFIASSLPRLTFRSTDGISVIDARVCEIRFVFALDGNGTERPPLP